MATSQYFEGENVGAQLCSACASAATNIIWKKRNYALSPAVTTLHCSLLLTPIVEHLI